jgi:hypothetical protein
MLTIPDTTVSRDPLQGAESFAAYRLADILNLYRDERRLLHRAKHGTR